MGPFAGGKVKEKNWRPFSVFLFPLRFNSCFSPSYTSSDFQFLTAGAPTQILNTNMYVHAYYELHENIDQTIWLPCCTGKNGFASPLLWSLSLYSKTPIQGRQDTTAILHLLSLALASTAF